MRLLCLSFCLCCSLLWAGSPTEVRIIAFDKLQGRLTTSKEGLGGQELNDYLSLDYHKPLIISLGDNYLGSFESLIDKGKDIARKLKSLDVRTTLLGSQDLCYGIEQFNKNCLYAKITALSTNLTSQNNKHLIGLPKTVCVVKNGYKIAFLGGYSQDFFVSRKVRTEPLAETIATEVQKMIKLPDEERPHAIILLLNFSDGFNSFSKKFISKELEETCKIKGLSAILISDKNSSSYQSRIKGTPLISTSLTNNEITQLDLHFNPKFKFLTSIQTKIVPINTALLGKSSPKTTKRKAIAFSTEKIENKADKKVFRTPLGNFVCHALYENISSDFVLLPSEIFHTSLPKGKITDDDIFQIFQRDYRLFTAKISGKKLREILSNIVLRSKDYQIFAPDLQYNKSKIVSLKSSGFLGLSPVDDDKLYTVLTTQKGFKKFLKDAKKKDVCDGSLVNSLIDELDGEEISPNFAK